MGNVKKEKTKELMVCTCGNFLQKIYVEFKGLKMQRIFVKCPKCGKESLVAYLEEKTIEDVLNK